MRVEPGQRFSKDLLDLEISNLVGLRGLLFGGPGLGESGKLGAFGDKAEGFLFGSPEIKAFDRGR